MTDPQGRQAPKCEGCGGPIQYLTEGRGCVNYDCPLGLRQIGDPSQKPGGEAKAPLASDDVLEAAAILKLLADGEDVSDQRADARRLARVLFNGWKAGLPAPEPLAKGPTTDDAFRAGFDAGYLYAKSNSPPPTPPGVEVGRAYDGSPMDIPWIIRSLEQIAKPLGDSDTGIARLMALRNFIQSLKHPPQEGRP